MIFDISLQNLVILLLIAFILGLVLGVSLGGPRIM